MVIHFTLGPVETDSKTGTSVRNDYWGVVLGDRPVWK